MYQRFSEEAMRESTASRFVVQHYTIPGTKERHLPIYTYSYGNLPRTSFGTRLGLTEPALAPGNIRNIPVQGT